MISAILLPKLQELFSANGLRLGSPPEALAVFPGIHPEVGNIEIYDDGDEVTIVTGKFTHGHFSNYDDSLTLQEKAEVITEQAVNFLRELFADEIVMWGSHERGGGWYRKGETTTWQQSEEGYVWSGPVQ